MVPDMDHKCGRQRVAHNGYVPFGPLCGLAKRKPKLTTYKNYEQNRQQELFITVLNLTGTNVDYKYMDHNVDSNVDQNRDHNM